MKKIISILLCSIFIFALAGCGSSKAPQEENSAQIPNPLNKYESLTEAEEKVGFSFIVPESLNGDFIGLVQTINDEIIEVNYGSDNKFCVRKGKGSEDISGDYNSYAKEENLDVTMYQETDAGKIEEIITKSDDDGKIHVVCWYTDKDFSYSIVSSEGIFEDDAIELVAEIN